MPRQTKTPQISYRKMSPAELRAAGYSPSSKRYVNASGQTISERQAQNLKNQARFGERVSRETVTKRQKFGTYEYATPQAKATAELQRRLARIRSTVTGIAPRDARVIDNFLQNGGYAGLNDDEQEAFPALFKRYNRDEVLDALGSPKTKRRAA